MSEILKSSDDDFNYKNEILDLKKENLLLLQQKIGMEGYSKMLEDKLKMKDLERRESIIKVVIDTRERFRQQIELKIQELEEEHTGCTRNALSVLKSLKEEI